MRLTQLYAGPARIVPSFANLDLGRGFDVCGPATGSQKRP
jgi:hypothetical protein